MQDVRALVEQEIEQMRENGDLLDCEKEWRNFLLWRCRDEHADKALPDQDWWHVPGVKNQMGRAEILDRVQMAACDLILASRVLSTHPLMQEVIGWATDYVERALSDNAYLETLEAHNVIRLGVIAERIGLWPGQPFPED